MKEDMIYKQNAIDVICLSWCGCQNSDCKHHFDPEVDESYWCDGCGDVEELKNIPSAQPEPSECICGECDAWNKYKSERKTSRWIPCSERLPEKHQMVLTTIKGVDLFRECADKNFFEALATAKKRTWVSVGYLGDDGWYGADGFPQIVQPIAWMSVPEPYKEGEEND